MNNPVTLPTGFDLDYAESEVWRNRDFGVLSKSMERGFRAELKRSGTPVRPGMRVLEVGFGSGEFIAYALKSGATVSGIEADGEWVSLARAFGCDARLAMDVGSFDDAQFDLVVAIDVLEHIPNRQMPAFLAGVRRVLRPGGMFLARFPNGDSPFGLRNQNGNVSHVNAIGTEKASYYSRQLGAEIIVLAGEARPIPAGNWRHTLQRIVAWPVKKLTNLVVSTIFLPGYRGDFSAVNLVLALRMPYR